MILIVFNGFVMILKKIHQLIKVREGEIFGK